MGTNLVLYENNQQIEISTEDIRKYIAPDLTEKEFWMFVQTAKTFGLNPIKREIYAVKYGNTFSVITGYQVYLQRIIQADILEYWDVDIEKPEPKNLDTWVGVFTAKRKDWAKEFVWKVPMKEVNKKQALWNLQPEFQLKKTAISQGCRMLAPDIVAGIPYTSEEMGVSEESQYESIPTPTKPFDNADKLAEPNGDDKQKANGSAKTAGWKIKIDSLLTLLELNDWATKQQKSIDKTGFKAEIEEMIASRRSYIVITMLSKVMNIDQQTIADFLDIAKPEDAVINEVMAGNADAITELAKRIEDFKAKRNEQAEGVQTEEEAEAELDMRFGEKTQEHNPPAWRVAN